MAAVAIRFHPAAGQEAESAYDWYAARNQSVALGFREELRHGVASVSENPDTRMVGDGSWSILGIGLIRLECYREMWQLVQDSKQLEYQ
jgi:plasmid stabilization system protein ParE